MTMTNISVTDQQNITNKSSGTALVKPFTWWFTHHQCDVAVLWAEGLMAQSLEWYQTACLWEVEGDLDAALMLPMGRWDKGLGVVIYNICIVCLFSVPYCHWFYSYGMGCCRCKCWGTAFASPELIGILCWCTTFTYVTSPKLAGIWC